MTISQSGGDAIITDNLYKSFGEVPALNGVSLAVPEGAFFGLLGPNGAGKTTLISILAGLCRPDSGGAKVLGKDAVADSLAVRAALGVVPQELVYDPFFNVRECLRFQSRYYGVFDNEEWIDELLSQLELGAKQKANTRALSGGMKRRLMIALALVHKPPVVVLDEPTAGVDINLRLSLWGFIRGLNAAGHTIVLTTHYLEEAEELCDTIALMKDGRIVAMDKTANLIRRFHDGIDLCLKLAGGAPPPGKWGDKVASVRADGCRRLRLAGYEEVGVLLADVRAAGLEISELEVAPPDLEDVFVRIVNR
jgi:ABC-2 type transport system ATP-binding protein